MLMLFLENNVLELRIVYHRHTKRIMLPTVFSNLIGLTQTDAT
jgi:hypothetical protein